MRFPRKVPQIRGRMRLRMSDEPSVRIRLRTCSPLDARSAERTMKPVSEMRKAAARARKLQSSCFERLGRTAATRVQ
eukprot:5907111-Prymnesium_polylepis.1